MLYPRVLCLYLIVGANTKGNKEKIRESGFHYLNVGRQRRLKPYRKYVEYFKRDFKSVDILEINERHYYCVKKMEKGEVFYIFFSPELYMDQLKGVKERKI